MRVWRWIAVFGIVAALAVGVGLGTKRWQVAPLPASAYLRPDQPSAPPSHVLLPASALGDFEELYFAALGKPDQPASNWTPTEAQIQELEFHLPAISSLRPYNSDKLPMIQNPASYNIQFLGVEMGGSRQIYINAACDLWYEGAAQWNSRVYMVWDGWTCFWHAFYNPVTRSFSNLEINVRA